jgi:GNAT superfamily N-acetyltransferase
MTIRPPVDADFPELGRKLAPLPLFQAYALGAEQLAQRWAQGWRQGDGLLVAGAEGAPAGLCWFLKQGTFGTGAYLRTLAVAPGEQSRGTGAALLKAFEDACARPSGGWFLLASAFNDGAHRFYARHGYVEVGRLSDFAKAGVEERIFWKALPRAGP